MKLRVILIFLIIFSLYSFPFSVSAQLLQPTESNENDIFITSDIKYPKIGDTITLELQSYFYDINTMYVRWSINGKISKEGIGEKFLEILYKNEIPINIKGEIVDTDTKQTITKYFTIENKNILLLWQVEDPILPPFYKGKAMPAVESTITYSVIPENLSSRGEYFWSVDFEKDLRNSGFNKYQFTKSHSLLSNTTTINVEKRVNGVQKGFATLDQLFLNPFLAWYTYLGNEIDIWNGSLTTLSMKTSPIKLHNVPFNMTIRNTDNLDVVYTLDDSDLPVKKNDKQNLLFETDGGHGTATLKTSIEQPDLVSQFIENVLKISY